MRHLPLLLALLTAVTGALSAATIDEILAECEAMIMKGADPIEAHFTRDGGELFAHAVASARSSQAAPSVPVIRLQRLALDDIGYAKVARLVLFTRNKGPTVLRVYLCDIADDGNWIVYRAIREDSDEVAGVESKRKR